MEWVESTGSSIDEAKDRALDSLGVHGDDAEFEVINDVKMGLFGRVKEEARVRARVAPATPRAKEERRRGKARGAKGERGGSGQRSRGRGTGSSADQGGRGQGRRGGGGREGDSREEGRESASAEGQDGSGEDRSSERGDKGRASSPKSRPKTDNRSASPRGEKRDRTMNEDEATMPLPEQADLAEEFVRGLAERFGTTVTFAREDVDEEEIRVTVSGDDLGRMIGRRGTTAGAIDELVRTVLQRQAGSSRNGRIRVDIGGVRARRAEALVKFTLEQAEVVRSTGARRALEPMSAADRKIVHDALTDAEGVETISEGEDAQRRVVIVPAGAGD